MSIENKLTQLTTIRGYIRSALVAKGVSASDHDFANFAMDISNVKSSLFDGSINYIAPSNINLSFNGSVTEE